MVCAIIFTVLPTVAFAAETETGGTCGANATWSFDGTTGTLTVSGTGAMYGYSNTNALPWKDYKEQIEFVVVEYGVTSIGNSAFYQCAALTGVTLPVSVTTIDANAFLGCTSLTSMTIPASVTTIGMNAFQGCISLTDVTIPASVTTIGMNAFWNCTSLESVTLPDSVSDIGLGAFWNCTSLESVTISNNVTNISNLTFSGCASLTRVTIPASVTTIGGSAFSGCTNLTDVTILGSNTQIQGLAFRNCTKLTSVNIPADLPADKIANTAFDGCTSPTINRYSYTVTFDLNGHGNSAPDTQYLSTDAATEPTAPYEEGYTFDGWYTSTDGGATLSDTAYDFDSPVTGNLVLYAKWTPTTYTISYEGAEAGSNPTEYTIESDEITLTNPTRTGYTFDGWSGTGLTGSAMTVTIPTGSTGNRTYTANWTGNTYTVKFVDEDGTELQSGGVAYGEMPAYTGETPAKEADAQYTYTFTGWIPAIAAVTGEVTYTATYSSTANSYAITYNTDGGTINSGAVETYTYGFGAVLPTDVVKDGYNFGGWYDNIECEGDSVAAIGTAESGDKNYYAEWTPAQLTGTITISGTVQVGETLTATVSDSNNTGTLSYKWYRHAENSILMEESANNVYVITEEAVAQKIFCVVSSDVQNGTLESEKTGIVPNLIFPVGSISAEGYDGAYDGQPHGITVTAPEETDVYYGTDGENYELNAPPAYTDAGTYTVYYRVVKDNYDGVNGSAVVNIGKADPTVTAWPTVKGTVYVNDNAVVLNDDGTVTGVDGAALDGSFAIGTVDLTSAGEKTVTVTFTPADSINYNTVEKADYQVTVSNRPVYYDPTYLVSVSEPENGTVKSNRRYAEYGQTVTVTVTPDAGYVLETLTVKTGSGRQIELTGKGDGKYTFKMPSDKVTVEAIFVEDNTMLNYFVDVFAFDYYYDAVLWAVRNGITNGSGATTFSPAAACTRAQTVTFLWCAAGCPEPESAACPFEDVDPSAYYYKAVLWAVENGITNGTSATAFSPDDTVTRSQIVTFLWRMAGSPAAKQTTSFGDVAADAYYHDAVAWAADEAITNGTGASTFSPTEPCTRAQIVTFLYRYYVA